MKSSRAFVAGCSWNDNATKRDYSIYRRLSWQTSSEHFGGTGGRPHHLILSLLGNGLFGRRRANDSNQLEANSRKSINLPATTNRKTRLGCADGCRRRLSLIDHIKMP